MRFCLFYLKPIPPPPPLPSPPPPAPAPQRALLCTLRSPPACGAVVRSPRTRLGAWISGSWPCGAVVHSPRTRLGAWISGRWPCGAVVHSPRARLGAWISGRWPCTFCYIKFFSASGEAILGTQRYLEQPLYSAVVLLPGQCIVLQYFCFFPIFRLRRKNMFQFDSR